MNYVHFSTEKHALENCPVLQFYIAFWHFITQVLNSLELG